LTPPCYHLRAAGDGGSFLSGIVLGGVWPFTLCRVAATMSEGLLA
jgi:hypothetical protein